MQSQRGGRPNGAPGGHRLAWLAAAAFVAVTAAHPALVDRTAVAGAAGFLLAVALALLGWRRRGAGVGPPPILLWPASAWVGAVWLSAAVSGSRDPVALLMPALAAVLVWLGWLLAGQPRDLATLRAALVLGAVAASGHALLQHLGWDPLPRADDFPDRIVGPFENPNHLASFASAVLPLLIASHLSAWSAAPAPRRPAGSLWGAAALLVYCALLLAGSRGALWAAAAGCAAVLVGYGRAVQLGRKPLRLGGPVGLALSMAAATAVLADRPVMRGPLGPVSVRQRLGTMAHLTGDAAVRDRTMLHRLVLWQAARTVIASDPWLGCGAGRFATACDSVLRELSGDERVAALDAAQRSQVPRFAHNEFLHLWAESGLVALVPFLCVLGLGLAPAARAAWAAPRLGAAGAAGTCAAVLVDGMASYPLYLPVTAGMFWMLLGSLYPRQQAP